jgi:hypothetical protein
MLCSNPTTVVCFYCDRRLDADVYLTRFGKTACRECLTEIGAAR